MKSGFKLILAQLWQDWSEFCSRRAELWTTRSLAALVQAKSHKPPRVEMACADVDGLERKNPAFLSRFPNGIHKS